MNVYIRRFDTYFILKYGNHMAEFNYSETTEKDAISWIKNLYEN